MLRLTMLTFSLAGLLFLSGCGKSEPGGEAVNANGGSEAGEPSVTTTGDESAANGNGRSVTNGNGNPAANGNGTHGDSQPGFATPEAAFEAFKSAMVKDDWKTAAGCLTEKSQEMMTGIVMLAVGFATLDEKMAPSANALMKKHGIDPEGKGDGKEFDEIDKVAFIGEAFNFLEKEGDNSPSTEMKDSIGTATLKDLEIEGDKAQAVLIASGQPDPEPIEFKRLDGRWFIQLPGEEEMVAGSDGEMNFGGSDFASGFDDEMWADYPEQATPPAEAISVEDFNASWQADLNIENQPAGEVLAKLASEIGLKFELPEEANEAMIKNVSVSLEKGTRLQAIEEVCNQIGMTPAFFPSALKLKPEPRQHPVAFAGPFLITVSELQERPPYATGRLTLRVYGAGLPATVGAAVDEAGEDGVMLTSVIDSDENGLIDEGQGIGAMARSANTILDTTADVSLKNLLKKVETLSVRGGIQFVLPTKVAVGKFEKLEAGATVKVGEVEFTIEDLDVSEQSSVSVKFKGVEAEKVQLVCYDAEKKPLSGFSNSFGFDGEGNISSNPEGELASLEVRIIEESSDISYEFELPKISLATFAQMPEQIEPLKFEGDAPVTFEFVKIDSDGDQKNLLVKATNHTNKPLEMLDMKIEYLDADGKTLEDSPYTHGSAVEPVVDAGKTKELEISAFFMPEGTKSAKISVTGLRGFDATTWQLEDQ